MESRHLFNFIQGSDITGESAYDIWKGLGNTGSEADFLEFIRSGPKGEKGEPGEATVVYGITASDTVIKKDIAGKLMPESIIFKSYFRSGTEATRHEYSGRFIIEETTDGVLWETKYTSTEDEAMRSYTPSSTDVLMIRCTLYSAGGTTDRLDNQTVAILTDASNIEIGARNLLSNSDVHREITKENTSVFSEIFSVVDGFDLQRFVNKNVILSYYADAAEADNYNVYPKVTWVNDTSEKEETLSSLSAVGVTKERINKLYDIKAPEGYETIKNVSVVVEISAPENDSVFVFERPKLEIGTLATEWTIAPEDVEVLVAILGNDAHVVATDYNGENGDFSDCSTDIKVYSGTRDVTSLATYEINMSDGLTGDWDLTNYTFNVTGLTNDIGYVDITATYKGVVVTKRFSVSKSKAGKSIVNFVVNVSTQDGETFIADKTFSEIKSAYEDNAEIKVNIENILVPLLIVNEHSIYFSAIRETSIMQIIITDEDEVHYEQSLLQPTEDSSLNTNDKTIVGAINEVKNDVSNTVDSVSDVDAKLTQEVNRAKTAEAKALTDSKSYTDSEISAHNTSSTSHNDIRDLISGLTTRLNALADSDDTTLDQMSEVVAYIKANKTLIESITTSKVNVSDIINNLTTNVSNKPLSAAQGVVIKALIDALQSELDNHGHDISDITDLQAALDGKAEKSHGTHVTYGTAIPTRNGTTGSAGEAYSVSRSDHKHPTDTSRAAASDLDSHVSDTTKHVTSTERTNWDEAKTHANSAHAPSDAQKNQNAFSNIAVSGQTTVAADTTTDTVTFVGNNMEITTDATNDKIIFSVPNGSSSVKGVVKLSDSTSSTSTSLAATANSVKSAYDLANTAKTKADSAYVLAESKVGSLSDLGITATETELNYMGGVTSKVQTQLDKKIANNPFSGGGTSGTSGYVAFAQLVITGSYVNRLIEFELICRGTVTPCYVSVSFLNKDSTDPGLNKLLYWGSDYGVFAHKTTTSTWLLYYTKTEPHDNVTVVRKQTTSQSITITHPGTFITEKPTSNVTNASLGGAIGSAGKAGKLTSSAGSATQPVYLSDGKPVATTHTLEASVPSDAKFTDTTYEAAGSSLGLVKSGGDVTISSGVITVKDDSHNHVISNVDGLQDILDLKLQYKGKLSSEFNFDSSDIEPGVYEMAGNKIEEKAYFGVFIQHPDAYKVQTIIGGQSSPTYTQIMHRRYIKNSNTWSKWTVDINSNNKNDYTFYTHPEYTAQTSGLYKITVDASGHVSAVTAVTKSDITDLGIPAQDTTYSAAGSSLGLVKSGGDVTISSGTITVKDDSHNHVISNVDGLQSALDGKLSTSLKGSASGLAELDENGKIVTSQLPSYVDDVIEGYLNSGKFYKESTYTTQITGETGKIYIDLSSNKTYRWSGSAFAVISDTLALGETSSTAYRGDRGKTAYTHSQAAHAPSNAQANVIETVKVNGTALTPSSKAVDITVPTKTSELTNDSGFKTTDNDTKNTAGSTNSSKKLYLIGAESQAANPQTYSHDTAYVGTDGCLYSGGSKVLTAHPTISTSNDTTSTASPSHGGTVTMVDSITRDSNGHVTKVNTKTVTLPKDTTYSAATTSTDGLMSANDKLKSDYTNIVYGTCSTAAATAAKVITISGNTQWKLNTGSIVIVKFSETNTASNPTLNVNSTGAKSVWYNTGVITTGSLGYAGTANRPMIFAYDGTQYVFLSWAYDNNTTYSNASLGQGYASCSTAEATTAKTASLSSYSLTTGGIVSIKFTNAVPASATLNVNSKGAKSIYYRGAAITAGIIKAGDIATFIYSSQYHLISIDRWQNDITTHSGDTTSHITATERTNLGAAYTHSQATHAPSNAEANQNAFSKVKVGESSINADSPTDTLTIVAGENITLTADTSNDKFTIAAKDTTYSTFVKSGSGAAAGLVPAPSTTAGTSKYLREDGTWATPTNTKSTAGSTDSSKKLFLIGAESQAANPQTYSHDTAYVGTNGHLYSNSKQVVNLSDSQALTNKTYNGYTLGAACAKGVATSVASENTNLVTSGAVYTALQIDYTKLQFDTTELVV